MGSAALPSLDGAIPPERLSRLSAPRDRNGPRRQGVEPTSTDREGLTAPRGEPALQGPQASSRMRHDKPHEEAKLTRRLYRQYEDEHDAWVHEASEDLEFLQWPALDA